MFEPSVIQEWSEFFEAAMLVCFGASWPFAVFKTWRSKTAKGKSLLFLSLLLLGYTCGTTHKLLSSFNFVILLYISNGLLVLTELLLVLRYRKAEKVTGDPLTPPEESV